MRRDPSRKVCIFLKCPMCGTRKPSKYTGINATMRGKKPATIKPPFRFGNIALDQEAGALVLFTQSYGSAHVGPRGFQLIDHLTLRQATVDPRWASVVEDLEAQCKAVLKGINHAREHRS